MAENFNGFKGHYAAAEKTFSLAGDGDVEQGIKKLEGDTIKETNENFVNATKELWKDFAVHGIMNTNPETKKRELKAYTDLDGKSALGLLKLTGMNVHDVKYVNQGDFIEGAINLDTGKRGGVQYEDDTKTAFFDHHLENHDPEHISATDLVYKTIVKLGLLVDGEYSRQVQGMKKSGELKDPEHLKKLVEFVNQIDNKSFPNQEKYYKGSERNMLGLSRFVSFESLLKFFQDGRTPIEQLSDEDLVRYGFIYKNHKGQNINRFSERKNAISSSLEALKNIEKGGFIVQSKKYGEIIIDRNGKVRDGADAAYAHNNCSVYIKWSDNGFFITSKTPFDDSFVLSQGIKVRDTMYLQPDEGEALKMDLGEVLDKLGAEY